MAHGSASWKESTPGKEWVSREPEAPGKFRQESGLAFAAPPLHAVRSTGGCFNELGWQALARLGEDRRDACMRLLFAEDVGCGFKFGRVPMGSNDFSLRWRDYSGESADFKLKGFSIEEDEEHLFPFVREALRHSPCLGLFASPWSPPTWMKRPRIFNGGRFIMEPEYLDAYARYFLAYAAACSRKGIPVVQLHVQNEPVSEHRFPSCLWTGADLAEFIGAYLGPAFVAAGRKEELWLGTLNGPDPNSPIEESGYDGYAGLILRDPAARRALAGVGYQWAGKWEVERTRLAWPQMRLMQTEAECGDGRNTFWSAFRLFESARHYLYAGCERFMYWNLVLPPGGRSTWGWAQNSLVTASEQGMAPNPDYWAMRHLFGAVPDGGRLLPLRGAWAANAVAYLRPDGAAVVAVANPLQSTEEVRIEGALAAKLPPRSFHTFEFPYDGER